MADRSGRPYVKGTFALLQAFLSAWTEKNPDRMEEITESRSHIELVTTQIAKFNLKDSNEVALVLPGVHPGPFNPIGGSNLPFILYELFANKALIMHSVSDHSLNIPSLTELQKYVRTIPKAKVLDKQNSCTVPTMINIDKWTCYRNLFWYFSYPLSFHGSKRYGRRSFRSTYAVRRHILRI